MWLLQGSGGMRLTLAYAHHVWDTSLRMHGNACVQEEARALFREQVYPDLVTSHKPTRAARGSAAADTYNAIVAPMAEKLLSEAFGADGAKLEARTLALHSNGISQKLAARTQGLIDQRDLARLSPWLAGYSRESGAAV